jgi:hypothetical protein
MRPSRKMIADQKRESGLMATGQPGWLLVEIANANIGPARFYIC